MWNIDHNTNNDRIILIKENRGLYSDMGGKIDPNEMPHETAIRETLEESRNLFDTSYFFQNEKNKKQHVDVKHDGNIYRSYVIYIDISQSQIKLLKKMYNKNMKYIENHKKKFNKCWNETTTIGTFDVKKCLEFYKNQIKYEKRPIIYDDRLNNVHLIRRRPMKALFLLLTSDKLTQIKNNKRKIKIVNNVVGNSIIIL